MHSVTWSRGAPAAVYQENAAGAPHPHQTFSLTNIIMRRIRSINSRRAVDAVVQPLKKKGVILEPGGDAANAIRSGVRVANRGIKALNQLIAGGEKVVDEGRDALHKATAPKPKRRPKS